MNGEAIITVSAAVVALTQLSKWAGLPNRWGSVAVLILALIGVAMWVWSQTTPPDHTHAFEYFAGWVAVATSAAGVFGFTRATADAITRTSTPPDAPADTPATKTIGQ